MTRFLSFLFLLFVIFKISGQSQSLKGSIVADSLEGFAINIVNYTKKLGTTNDANGYFEIPARVKDSIIFSSVQYEIISVIVSEEDLANENFVVTLHPVIRKLSEVQVSDIHLSGNINKDAKDIEVLPVVNNRTLGLPFKDREPLTQIERRIYTARSSNGPIPVDLIINTISGRIEKLKRVKSIEELKKVIQLGKTTFNTSFFVEALGLPENLITDFMYYCAEDDYFEDLLENSKRFSLLKFFEQKARLYKNHKEID